MQVLGGYGYCNEYRVEQFLRDEDVKEVHVMGLATDYCVKNTALDAKLVTMGHAKLPAMNKNGKNAMMVPLAMSMLAPVASRPAVKISVPETVASPIRKRYSPAPPGRSPVVKLVIPLPKRST